MGGLHFEVADFTGLVNSNDTAKMKLAILSFLCCRKFVKTPITSSYCYFSVRVFPIHILFCYREIQFFDDPSAVRWKSSVENQMEKSVEKSPPNKFLFNVLYPNMDNLNFHIWKYLKLGFFSENQKNNWTTPKIHIQMLHPLCHKANSCYI